MCIKWEEERLHDCHRKLTTDHWYVAVRRTEHSGREWFDCYTISLLPEEVYEKAAAFNRQLPHYAAANPVVRIVRVKIIELEESCIRVP